VADESAILRNDVYFPGSLPSWSDGRVVLVGDAAHATTPGVGQGAAQAIEDAVVLAERLAGGGDLATALGEYEQIRRPRAEAVWKLSRRVDKAAQLASPLGWRLRNALVRRLPERAKRRQLEPVVRYELKRRLRRTCLDPNDECRSPRTIGKERRPEIPCTATVAVSRDEPNG
jgi:2-polyprenyl-6-methoxyphenol hydroxylase-like FAD-dependent oxidoreductase